MNNLAKLTWEYHKSAERQRFAKYLVSGKITKEHYAVYLYNVYPQYNKLEMLTKQHDLLDVEIAPKIFQDFVELGLETKPSMMPSVQEYMDYLDTIAEDKHKIMAHVYVRHMGDLSGGQIIAKRVPGNASMYQFDETPEVIKSRIRSRCTDDMANEANRCFEFVTNFFVECEREFDLG